MNQQTKSVLAAVFLLIVSASAYADGAIPNYNAVRGPTCFGWSPGQIVQNVADLSMRALLGAAVGRIDSERTARQLAVANGAGYFQGCNEQQFRTILVEVPQQQGQQQQRIVSQSQPQYQQQYPQSQYQQQQQRYHQQYGNGQIDSGNGVIRLPSAFFVNGNIYNR